MKLVDTCTSSEVALVCDECKGDGYFVYDGGPGRFDEWCGNWIPTEVWVVCQACGGVGEVQQYQENITGFETEPIEPDMPF